MTFKKFKPFKTIAGLFDGLNDLSDLNGWNRMRSIYLRLLPFGCSDRDGYWR
jgi:hypothetical protein